MGSWFSKEDLILEESSSQRLPYDRLLKMSEWDYVPAKNFDYYAGKRFTKISRRFYPEYTRGYLYGYWYEGKDIVINNYGDDDNEEEYEI
jgi:hypothetical protein